MTYSRPYHIAILQSELGKRSKRNPSYSLRSFARDLKIDPGALSAIFSERRQVTFGMAMRLGLHLRLSSAATKRLLNSVAVLQSERKLKRRDPKVMEFLTKNPRFKNPRVIDIELFQIISDWYHAAILELSFLEEFCADPDWIAKQIGISKLDAKLALARLLEAGLLKEIEGRLVKTNDHIELDDPDRTSKARRAKQKQIRMKAVESIDKDPVEKRYMTTISMAIDPDLLPEARRRIDEFNDSLSAFLESGKRKQVYAMEIGIFPLQIDSHGKEKK